MQAFADLQLWLFEAAVQPLMYALGVAGQVEWAFDATGWFLVGLGQIVLLGVALGAAERLWPAEVQHDRAARRTDFVYTLLHRLGGFAIAVFFLLQPAFDWLEGQLRLLGAARLQMDALWPGVTDRPVVSFLIYLVLFDLVDYWLHRGQHAWRWWWSLHALHHSQREMHLWSDNRNHLLDDLLRDAVFALVGIALGVPPSQFVLLVVAGQVLQSVQHANLRWRFGPFESVLVSPSFHRLHHGIGAGHEGAHRGCNFAVLFPVWDRLFGTADFRPGFVPTGIRDQLAGRDYGRGFWQQQWLGLRRLAGLPDQAAPRGTGRAAEG